ncbi:putative bifunctional diguanylate cyclase/phosphodiesterase [Rhizobium mesoamericanum]|uniref:Diguanylate cyclase/phosphodiesterase n=1 Tax=Rhizobium mesoamericanum STM3625 TaxID=1211777 RepID=K0PQ64_9HYPH|nr:bifunctional diguanylate cyclase/phosphodiesterase [Rhizobium mesoamericanum]CCM75993.1 Diguanylate cyclase/phosphodiesterase [Rhizobium mesoamericanum STM3625]
MKHTRFRSLLLILILPLFAALVIYIGLFSVLELATERSDKIAAERQKNLAETLVSKMQAAVAHDQESATVWDDAVRNVSDGNAEWMKANLGKWMFTYFQHDRAYVIAPNGRAIYVFAADEADSTKAYQQVSDIVSPLVNRLRARLATGDDAGISDQVLSIGESDLLKVNNHPAIVSVKPIISDTGNIEQKPSEIYLHVAVRYLDGSFLARMSSEYQFDGLNFAWTKSAEDKRSFAAARNADGREFGYFSWHPFEPGEAVAKSVRPALAAVGLSVFVALAGMGAVVAARNRKLRQSRAELEHLARHDTLTGLANRARFSEHLATAISGSAATQSNAVLFMDLDRFKQVNDTMGHPVGDRLLVLVADRLRRIFPDSVVGRLGGDEFTAVITDVTSDQVSRSCEQVIESMRRPFEIAGTPISIGASIGVVIGVGPDVDPSDLTRKADIALYNAKAAGRNRFAIFGPHMDELVQERRALESDLRLAVLNRRDLEVHFQPVYAAPNGALYGAEALLRWKHPLRGLISPEVFIPIAEECGVITQLGDLVLEEACLAAQRWPDLEIAINASPLELNNEAYSLRVIAALNKHGIDPARLEIEITEGTLLDSAGECQRNIEALRSTGVRVALDDFGTGFSFFGRLQYVAVDRIKIDKSFVGGFDSQDADNRAIVEAMIRLARAKGLKTTAEGVETEEQRAILKELGCDHLQGYLMSKPMTKDAFDRMVGTNVIDLQAKR